MLKAGQSTLTLNESFLHGLPTLTAQLDLISAVDEAKDSAQREGGIDEVLN